MRRFNVLFDDKLRLALLFADPIKTVYDEIVPDENEDPPVEDPPADPPVVKPPVPAPKPKPKVTFTAEQQEYMNSVLAEDRRKNKAATDKVITQLETLKNQVGTTAAEKESLESRIEDLKNSQLTAEEMRKKEEVKKTKKHADELTAANKETSKWKDLYVTSTVHRAINDAAITSGAHNPKHIVAIVAPDTRLVEEFDEEGKATGQLVPRVRVQTVKDGKPTTLEMAVTEAVKFMKEQDEHAPLFNSGATGGVGSTPNNPKKKGVNSDTPPTDPTEYREWRKKNMDKVGGPTRRTPTAS